MTLNFTIYASQLSHSLLFHTSQKLVWSEAVSRKNVGWEAVSRRNVAGPCVCRGVRDEVSVYRTQKGPIITRFYGLPLYLVSCCLGFKEWSNSVHQLCVNSVHQLGASTWCVDSVRQLGASTRVVCQLGASTRCVRHLVATTRSVLATRLFSKPTRCTAQEKCVLKHVRLRPGWGARTS